MGPRHCPAGPGLALIAVLVIAGFLALRLRPAAPPPPEPSPAPSRVAIASPPPTAVVATPAPTARSTPDPTLEPTPPRPSGPIPSVEALPAVADDGTFRLQIAAASDTVRAGEPIGVATWLSYVGPQRVVEFGHADPAVTFAIQQLDGAEQMTGLGADVCLSTRLARGDRTAVPFRKAGEIRGIFDEAWYRDPLLRLPPGQWQIVASLEADIPACGPGDEHRERVGVTVTVTP